ncbi:UNVERIFIED_CONTAM: hypothetical protein PYX00_006053 [Menopon gallinae]|uniref:small monomeric GTPase n=1 Tax=Menopon gallinae TaxID=328185 RepID=A0AAW2HV07_9NEOP
MVLGQEGVGKSALVVRFITRRFIGEYDRNLEKVYSFQTSMDNESVSFEILDTVGQPQDEGCLLRESNIRWAEAFILMYSVTDKCSFEDCTRLKFLVNYNKRRKRLGSECKDAAMDVPVLLIGNKTDLARDRMVSKEEGLKRSKDIGCVCFHEISVRESVDQVRYVFRDVFHFWKAHKKLSKLKRSSSESENGSRSCAEHRGVPCSSKSPSPSAGGSDCTLTGTSTSRFFGQKRISGA